MSNGTPNGANGTSGRPAEDVYARVASSSAARSQSARPTSPSAKGAPVSAPPSKPGAAKPSATKPSATKPSATKPSAAKPSAAKPGAGPTPPAPSTIQATAQPSAQPAAKPAGAKPGLFDALKGKLSKVSELTAKATGKDDDPPAVGQPAPSALTSAPAPAKDPVKAPVKAPPAKAAVPAPAHPPVATPRPTVGTRTPAAPATPAPVPADAAKPKVGVARSTRKARLRLARVDPWSVMKTSFLFSIAGGIMLVVGTYAVWTVISSSGLFDNINEIVASVVSTPGDTTPFKVEDYVNTAKVMGITAFLACIDVVIITALATLGAFLYNLAATMLGGLEITLAED